jgi:DNA-binding transcriptional MerR regulator
MVVIEVFTLEEWELEKLAEVERQKEEGYADRVYTPEDEEIVDYINTMIREDMKMDRTAENIAKELKKRQKTWKVSVKRIKKFLREE